MPIMCAYRSTAGGAGAVLRLFAAGWTVAPSPNYVTLVSDDIRAIDIYGTDSDFFFVGVSLSKSF